MNKKTAAVLAVLAVTFSVLKPANAESIPAIAILDTAINSDMPLFQNKISHEVCILEFGKCPNNSSFMEGRGSANMSQPYISKNNFDHGTKMASIAIQNNPDINIVFVRFVGSDLNGNKEPVTEKSLSNALDWVLKNKDTFNIKTISVSQGVHIFSQRDNYCPQTTEVENKINQLKEFNIPVFFPSGNDGDYKKIDWPACLSPSIAVGAISKKNKMSAYSNFDPNFIDFFASGDAIAIDTNNNSSKVFGTSVSTIIAATQWATIVSKNSQKSYEDIYSLIYKTSLPIKISKTNNGKLINLKGALNGK